MIYRAIGKFVVQAAIYFVRWRYGRQIRFALGLGLAAVVIGGFFAARDVPEG